MLAMEQDWRESGSRAPRGSRLAQLPFDGLKRLLYVRVIGARSMRLVATYSQTYSGPE